MKFHEGAILLAAGGTFAVWGASKMLDKELPACFRDPSISNCTPDVDLPSPNPPDALTPDQPFTSKVEGDITKIEVTDEVWPLFNRNVDLRSLKLVKGGDIKYESTSKHIIGTAMDGRIVSIVHGEGNNREAFIMAVDDQGTEDKTDDRVVPINVNDFDMVSTRGVHEMTYPADAEADYNNCIAQLNAGNPEFQGCILSGVDGHDDNIDPVILDNLRMQYLAYDGCVVKTLHVASNVVLAGITGLPEWEQIYDDTVTISEVAATSLARRMSSLQGIPIDRTHVVMELGEHGKPVEWDPDDQVDLSAVEEISNGEYNPPDVSVSNFCIGGSWKIDGTPEETIPALREMIGSELLDEAWLRQFEYTPVVPPKEVTDIRFEADGSFRVGTRTIIPLAED